MPHTYFSVSLRVSVPHGSDTDKGTSVACSNYFKKGFRVLNKVNDVMPGFHTSEK